LGLAFVNTFFKYKGCTETKFEGDYKRISRECRDDQTFEKCFQLVDLYYRMLGPNLQCLKNNEYNWTVIATENAKDFFSSLSAIALS
jgi:hypothetical protein